MERILYAINNIFEIMVFTSLDPRQLTRRKQRTVIIEHECDSIAQSGWRLAAWVNSRPGNGVASRGGLRMLPCEGCVR